MKKHLKSILFYSVVSLAIYILSQCILGIFGLQFRAKINVWWLGITFGLFGTKKRFTAIGYETDDAGNKVFMMICVIINILMIYMNLNMASSIQAI